MSSSQAIGMGMVIFGGSLYASRWRSGGPTVVSTSDAADDDLLDLVDEL